MPWMVHYVDAQSGEMTCPPDSTRENAFTTACSVLRQKASSCYIEEPSGARIELEEIQAWCAQHAKP